MFFDSDGPDLVFNTVSDWIHDFEGHCIKLTVCTGCLLLLVKLEEEKDQPRVSDACTQMPKGRRRGGKASRMRRLFAYQLMLTRKRGLPRSRLQLTLEEADARPSKRAELKRIQDESTSPFLREGVVGMRANNNMGKNSDHLHLDLEEEAYRSPSFF